MINLTATAVFWLALLAFFSGLCFGFALGIYLVNRRYKKNKEALTIAHTTARSKNVVLTAIKGGKEKDR